MLLERTRLAVRTIKKRADFLAVRGGVRASVPVCLLEAKLRPEATKSDQAPRFGFTVTKKLGNAVTRNRIRRRLKAAIAALAPALARDGFDYVIVARSAALDRAFTDMLDDLARALRGVHKSQGNGPQGAREQRLDKHPATMKKPQQRGPA